MTFPVHFQTGSKRPFVDNVSKNGSNAVLGHSKQVLNSFGLNITPAAFGLGGIE